MIHNFSRSLALAGAAAKDRFRAVSLEASLKFIFQLCEKLFVQQERFALHKLWIIFIASPEKSQRRQINTKAKSVSKLS